MQAQWSGSWGSPWGTPGGAARNAAFVSAPRAGAAFAPHQPFAYGAIDPAVLTQLIESGTQLTSDITQASLASSIAKSQIEAQLAAQKAQLKADRAAAKAAYVPPSLTIPSYTADAGMPAWLLPVALGGVGLVVALVLLRPGRPAERQNPRGRGRRRRNPAEYGFIGALIAGVAALTGTIISVAAAKKQQERDIAAAKKMQKKAAREAEKQREWEEEQAAAAMEAQLEVVKVQTEAQTQIAQASGTGSSWLPWLFTGGGLLAVVLVLVVGHKRKQAARAGAASAGK